MGWGSGAWGSNRYRTTREGKNGRLLRPNRGPVQGEGNLDFRLCITHVIHWSLSGRGLELYKVNKGNQLYTFTLICGKMNFGYPRIFMIDWIYLQTPCSYIKLMFGLMDGASNKSDSFPEEKSKVLLNHLHMTVSNNI